MIDSYLSQEFNCKVLELVKQKRFYPFEYISSSGKFKERLPRKGKFYSSLKGKRISNKEYEHVLKVWNRLENEKILCT